MNQTSFKYQINEYNLYIYIFLFIIRYLLCDLWAERTGVQEFKCKSAWTVETSSQTMMMTSLIVRTLCLTCLSVGRSPTTSEGQIRQFGISRAAYWQFKLALIRKRSLPKQRKSPHFQIQNAIFKIPTPPNPFSIST